jgi:hypothetical protein
MTMRPIREASEKPDEIDSIPCGRRYASAEEFLASELFE